MQRFSHIDFLIISLCLQNLIYLHGKKFLTETSDIVSEVFLQAHII